MARGGTFTQSDPSEVVDFMEGKLLKKGFFGKLRARYDAVLIQPHATDSAAVVRIGAPGLLGKNVGVLVSEGGGGNKDTIRKLEAANVAGPALGGSMGLQTYDFPPDTPVPELVQFALRALTALGATPADGRWVWEASQPADVG